jgi:hypothetical protein
MNFTSNAPEGDSKSKSAYEAPSRLSLAVRWFRNKLGGALLGSTIGIDRYYIRKWFDHTEGVVHGSHHKESALIERSAQIARLKSAAKADERTKMQLDSGNAERPASLAISEPAPSDPEQQTPIASLSKAANDDIPSTKIKASEATLQRRLADIQRAMEIPAI